MQHKLFESIDEMLAPDTLGELEGRPVKYVRCASFQPERAHSGSRFLKIETDSDPGSRYFVKRFSSASDWIMRNTDDRHCRTVRLWQRGLFDRLPPEIDHAILACAHDGDGWAVLMRDVSAGVIPYTLLSRQKNERLLKTQATLHTTFWQMPGLDDSELGLCTTRHLYTILSPQTGRREAGGPVGLPGRIVPGWELWKTMVAEDVAGIVEDLLDDPQPLCAALARYPHTLIHGDYRHANLAYLRGEPDRVVLLDWHLAAVAPPAVDLANYLGGCSAILPVSKEACIELYRQQLAQGIGAGFDESWWQPQLELALLGQFVKSGWNIARNSTINAHNWVQETGGPDHWRAALAWWSERARAGAKWL